MKGLGLNLDTLGVGVESRMTDPGDEPDGAARGQLGDDEDMSSAGAEGAKDPNSYDVSDAGTLRLGSLSRGHFSCDISREGLSSRDGHTEGSVTARDVCVYDLMGQGASSIVKRGIDVRRNAIIAVKLVKVGDKEKRQQLLKDLRALVAYGGAKGLVTFDGAFYEPEPNRLSICLEYMDHGSLADVLKRVRYLPEDVLGRVALDVIQGLKTLHSRHMVHRDIKPANILINSRGEAKITDFGISAGLAHTQEMCATWVGTVLYMSPERVDSRGYSYSADIWSLGLTLMESASGKYPYDTTDGPLVLMLHVLEDDPPSMEDTNFGDEVKELLHLCLRKEPEERGSADDLLECRLIKTTADKADDGLLRTFLKDNIPAEDVLRPMGLALATHVYQVVTGSRRGGEKKGSGTGPCFLRSSTTLLFDDGEVVEGKEGIVEAMPRVFDMRANAAHRTKDALEVQSVVRDQEGAIVLTTTGPTNKGGNFCDCIVLREGEERNTFWLQSMKMQNP